MEDRLEQQRAAQAAHAAERAEVDGVMAAIEAEDRQQAALRAARAADTMGYVRAVLQEREERREEERAANEDEERKIQARGRLAGLVRRCCRAERSKGQACRRCAVLDRGCACRSTCRR